jgi:hypothetical protein
LVPNVPSIVCVLAAMAAHDNRHARPALMRFDLMTLGVPATTRVHGRCQVVLAHRAGKNNGPMVRPWDTSLIARQT